MANELLDTLEFDTSNGQAPDVALATGTIYAIVYEGPDNDIWVKTVSVSSSGVITDLNKSLELDSGTCRTPRIKQLADGYLAIVYTGTGDDGFLKTISVDGSGNIALVDTWEFDTSYGSEPYLWTIAGTVKAISYGGSSDGWVKTVDISDTGIITKSWIGTLSFDGVTAQASHGSYISGDIWAIIYRGTGLTGQLCTVDIDAAGNIGATIIDSFTFADDIAESGQWPWLVHINGTIYAFTFSDTKPATDTIELRTIDIQNDGAIAAAVTDSAEVAASGGGRNNISLYDTNVFLITFHIGNLFGDLTAITIAIADDGTIGAIEHTLAIAGSYGNGQLETATSKLWVLVSEGSGRDGFIYTIREVTFIPKIMIF